MGNRYCSCRADKCVLRCCCKGAAVQGVQGRDLRELQHPGPGVLLPGGPWRAAAIPIGNPYCSCQANKC